MSWYEATTAESISLCRALLDESALASFDDVLKTHGLARLARPVSMKPTQTNHKEAIAELEWLREFLNNVNERAIRLGLPIKKRQAPPLEPQPENPPQDESQQESARSAEESTTAPSSSAETPVAQLDEPQSANARPNGTANTWRQRMAERNSQRERAEKADIRQKQSRNSRRQALENRLPKPAIKSMKSTKPMKSMKLYTPKSVVQSPEPAKAISHQPSTQQTAIEQPAVPQEVWCICRGPSAGLMLACDNSKCPYEWFHTSCVGLSRIPSTKWFCPACRPRVDRARRRRH